jgi:hypothetical protein
VGRGSYKPEPIYGLMTPSTTAPWATLGHQGVGQYSWPYFFPERGSFERDLLEQNPNAAYQRGLDAYFGMLLPGTAPQRFFASQQDETYNRYLGWALAQPDVGYGYVDFLQDYLPSLETMYRNLSPQARGSRFPGSAPRGRWIGY